MYFRDAYWYLSNMYPVTIHVTYPGVEAAFEMPALENAFQAAKVRHSNLPKTTWADTIAAFQTVRPLASKQLGREVPLNLAAWQLVAYDEMRRLLRIKFSPGSDCANLLLATGDIDIVEDNHHGDTLWGRVDGQGRNLLGEALMATRADLRTLGTAT